MATPQRQVPNEPRRGPELTNLSQGGVEKKVGPGWRFGFWWIWILIIAGIWYVGFGWGSSGGWIWGHRAHNVQSRNDAAMIGDGVPMLNSTNKQQYVGQAFEIRNAPVQRQASGKALWIGSQNNDVPMLVVLPGGNDVAAAPAGTNGPEYPNGNAPGQTTVTPNGAHTAASAAGSSQNANSGGANVSGASSAANEGGSNAAVATGGPRQWIDVTGKVQKAPPAAQAKQQWGLSDADVNRLEGEGVYVQATQVQSAEFQSTR